MKRAVKRNVRRQVNRTVKRIIKSKREEKSGEKDRKTQRQVKGTTEGNSETKVKRNIKRKMKRTNWNQDTTPPHPPNSYRHLFLPGCGGPLIASFHQKSEFDFCEAWLLRDRMANVWGEYASASTGAAGSFAPIFLSLNFWAFVVQGQLRAFQGSYG